MNKKTVKFLRELAEKPPLSISPESTNRCSANCSFCGYRYMHRQKGIMDFEMYKDIIYQSQSMRVKEIKFTCMVGDVFVDRAIIKKIQFANALTCFNNLNMYTVLIGLKDEQVDDLINSGINDIEISMCLQGRDDYKRLYGVDCFDAVFASTISLLKSNRRHANKVKIIIGLRHDRNFVLRKSPYFRKIAKLTNKVYLLNEYDNWAGLIKEENLPKGQVFKRPKDMTIPCCQLYNGMIVTHNGDVGICWTRDPNLELKIGNMHNQSLIDIWRGEKLRKLREDWINGQIPSYCRKCLTYTRIFDHPLIIKYVQEYNLTRLIGNFIRRKIWQIKSDLL